MYRLEVDKNWVVYKSEDSHDANGYTHLQKLKPDFIKNDDTLFAILKKDVALLQQALLETENPTLAYRIYSFPHLVYIAAFASNQVKPKSCLRVELVEDAHNEIQIRMHENHILGLVHEAGYNCSDKVVGYAIAYTHEYSEYSLLNYLEELKTFNQIIAKT